MKRISVSDVAQGVLKENHKANKGTTAAEAASALIIAGHDALLKVEAIGEEILASILAIKAIGSAYGAKDAEITELIIKTLKPAQSKISKKREK